MEDMLREIFGAISSTKVMLLMCTGFIVVDTLTGLIKAFKTKSYNSSINRSGIASKMMWFVMIGLGALVQWLIDTPVLLWLVGFSCMFSEFMSMIENARDCGVELKINDYLKPKDE